MRINIVIDDQLMKTAQASAGVKTKREVVEQGLKALITLKSQRDIRRLRGKLKWDDDLDAMRRNVQ